MKLCIVLSCIIALSLCAQSQYIVLNTLGETLSRGEWLDPLENNLRTVGSMPNQLVIDDEGILWVVASGDNWIGKFTAIDPTLPSNGHFSLPSGSNPYLMFKNDIFIYTTLWVTGQVAKINTSNHLIRTSSPFCLAPQGIFADDNYVYVADGNLDPVFFTYGPGLLWRLDTTLTVVDSIVIGTNPQQIIADDSGYLHIICTGDYADIEGSAYIVDPASFAVVDSVALGGTPARIAIDTAIGIAYSATSRYESWVSVPGSGKLLAYDVATRELIWSAHDSVNSLDGTGLSGLAVSGNYAYVPSMDSSFLEIAEICSTGVETIAKLTTGFGPIDIALFGPTGIAENPAKPDNMNLSAYPNPFNSSVTISLSVTPATSLVIPGSTRNPEIEVFDITGRKIAEITPPAPLDRGEQEKSSLSRGDLEGLVWQPDKSLGSGVYLVRARFGDESVSKRIIYLK